MDYTFGWHYRYWCLSLHVIVVLYSPRGLCIWLTLQILMLVVAYCSGVVFTSWIVHLTDITDINTCHCMLQWCCIHLVDYTFSRHCGYWCLSSRVAIVLCSPQGLCIWPTLRMLMLVIGYYNSVIFTSWTVHLTDIADVSARRCILQ